MCEDDRTVGEVIEFIFNLTGKFVPELVFADDCNDGECKSA